MYLPTNTAPAWWCGQDADELSHPAGYASYLDCLHAAGYAVTPCAILDEAWALLDEALQLTPGDNELNYTLRYHS